MTLPAFNPNCRYCGGSGYVDYYSPEQSIAERCRCWTGSHETNHSVFDKQNADKEGFLPGWPIRRAKYYGAWFNPGDVDTIVMHCGNSSSPNFASYFSNPWELEPGTGQRRDRRVSAHAGVLDNGTIEQYVPYTHKAYHCGRYNATSLGIEHQGPHHRKDWPDALVAASRALVRCYMTEHPSIKRLVAHRYLAPARRKDPGEHFPWDVYEDLGLEILT